MGELLSGRTLADDIHRETREQLTELREECHIEPTLAIITAGTQDLTKNGELQLHADVARNLGVRVNTVTFDDNVAEGEVIQAVLSANADPSVHGILVLLPLPEHIDQERVILAIAPEKELEGLREPEHGAPLPTGKKASTIAAVLALLKETKFNIISGRGVLIIEDDILESNAVVSRLLDLIAKLKLPLDIVTTGNNQARTITSKADVLLVSVSRPEYVDGTFIKDGAVVIDFNPVMVGQKYSEKKQRIMPILKNGVKLEEALARASYVAPAIGGVGPVALAMMMKNFAANYRALSVLAGPAGS